MKIKVWLAKFSIQQKMVFLLTLGITGFLVYFSANLVISKGNQNLMQSLVEDHLPMLEVSESLSVNLGAVKHSVVQNAFSAGMDGVASLESANGRVLTSFTELKKRGAGRITDLEAIQLRYTTTYKTTSDILQNVVAGLDTLASVQSKLQAAATELAALEKWSVALKEKQTLELRSSVDSAIVGSQRAMTAGWALILAGMPFAMLFFFTMREITAKLQIVSTRLLDVVQSVLNISGDASASSSRLASASGQQAAAITESVSSMEEMKSMLGQTVRHSAEALNSSEESFREAANGQEVINEMRNAMLDIERAYAELEVVNQVVSSIRSKTNIINDIVFKTQLLSFNASIEAARAGQHGRGFSVVAAEVGKLAEMSGLAAQEIGKLLDHSTKKVAEIVESTKGKVASANQMSQKCATVFERITGRTAEVKTMVDSITGAASEQEAGIQQVSRAMMELKDTAEQSDKLAQDISELSDSLRGQSETLAAAVERLETLVQGSRSETARVVPMNRGGTPQQASKPQRKSA